MSYTDLADRSETRGTMMDGSGRTVGLFSAHVPREILYAFGCTPVRVFPTAEKPTAAEAYLPRNFCALTRLILASFLENGEADLDAVIFTDEDDAMRRLHDVWRRFVPVPVWGFVEVPRTSTPLAVSRYADILMRTAADLAAHTGISLEPTALQEAIALYNEQRNLLAELKGQWLAGSVNTATYRRLRQMALTQAPKAANQRLRRTLEVTAEAAESLPVPPSALRLLLLAELAAPAGLVRLVEAHGARVVAEDSDLDEQDLRGPVSIEAETIEDIMATLAHAYLTKPPGPRMRDLSRRLAYLTHLVEERGTQAAICAYGKFCDLHLAEFPSLKAHLGGLGIPVLLLELEDQAISGQHRTRVEAFLEMRRESP
jgi:benzoyl-CoA reductase/2-hydroxyglutaryl-CoA dehydratase subunit BcrC/BadD/HgdB